jgi:hypothetical protein
MRHAYCFLRRFASDARGNMSVEAMLMLPVLVWALIAFFSFWDVYRINYLAKKATFTIADVISRERAQISAAFAFRYGTVFAYAVERPIPLTSSNSRNQPIVIRVTSLGFTESGAGSTTSVLWSMSSDATRLPLRDAAGLADLAGRIPAMLDGDNIIVIETRVYWSPSFYQPYRGAAPSLDFLQALQTREIDTITTVRPRFVPKLCFTGAGMTVACEL